VTNRFISLEHLRQKLQDIQNFLLQNRPQSASPSEPPLSQKLTEQHQLRLKQKLGQLHAADLAHIIENLMPEDRLQVWELIPAEQRAEIVIELPKPVKTQLLDAMPMEDMVSAADSLKATRIHELAWFAQNLPEPAVERILASLQPAQRQQMEDALTYPAGSVGSLMDFDVISVPEQALVQDVLAICRSSEKLPENTDQIYVVNANNELCGAVLLQDLVCADFATPISAVMSKAVISFGSSDSADQASWVFDRYKLTAAPVVKENNQILGRIGIDDIVDFNRETRELQVLQNAGFFSSEDWLSGILAGAKNRWLWVAINLFLAFFATRVITLFEDKIAELVILAALMPIVASTAGSIGNQASTLITRALALGQMTMANIRQFYVKEVGISALNGLVCGGLMGIFVASLYGFGLGLVIGIALLINFVATVVVAITIPLIRYHLNRDPAIGVHVLVTFFADSFGFFIFLGMATAFL
jgi:magnesium transporter